MGAEKCTFSKKVRKVRFVRKSSSQTSVKSLRGIIRQKVKNFLKFSNNKKVTKSHFRVFAYVYEEIGGLESSKSQKCALSNFLHFGAPESAKADFFLRVRRFYSIRELQNHFFHFWAVPGCPGRHEGQPSWRTEGRTPRSRDGLPYGRPGSRHGPARRWGWALLKSYPVCGSASIPPPLQ